MQTHDSRTLFAFTGYCSHQEGNLLQCWTSGRPSFGDRFEEVVWLANSHPTSRVPLSFSSVTLRPPFPPQVVRRHMYHTLLNLLYLHLLASRIMTIGICIMHASKVHGSRIRIYATYILVSYTHASGSRIRDIYMHHTYLHVSGSTIKDHTFFMHHGYMHHGYD